MKRGRFILFFLLVLIQVNFVIAAAGMRPALYEVDFESNKQYEFGFSAFNDDPEKQLKIYAKGDLSEYVEFDKESLIGGGGFKVFLNLPEKVEKPGTNRLYIGVSEVVEEGGGLGTSINIQSLIKVNVPYPGKYAEIKLETKDVNQGEDIDFKLEIYSRGDESIFIEPRIDITTDKGEHIKTLSFSGQDLGSNKKIELNKKFSTKNINSGTYNASAVVVYGNKKAYVSRLFRVGSLDVSIINYTEKLPKNKISKFKINIESNWNDFLDVFADVYIKEQEKVISEFRTPTITLEKLGKGVLESFFDTTEIETGIYEGEIILKYSNSEKKQDIEIEVYNESGFINYVIYVVIGLVIIVLIIFIIKWLKKQKNQGKK